MAQSNSMMQRQQSTPPMQQPKFSAMVSTKGWQTLINNTLRDPKRASNFIASITSAVVNNPELQSCENQSILSAALLGESLGLSPSPQLGQYYLVPFKRKAKIDRQTGEIISPETKVAQFVLGYKGYIQLALRTGQYKKLIVLEIKEGEFGQWDPLNEELECVSVDDPEARELAPTVGYYAMFEYMSGFKKTMYWSKAKMLKYADRYSPAFSAQAYKDIEDGKISERDMWKYSSFWYKDFDDMAKKTMLRQIISKWGIMSAEFTRAMENDMTFREMQGDNIITTTENDIMPEPDYMDGQNYTENPVPPEELNLDDL